jgi:RNA polymerase sigma factor (sigma-70 family)
MEDVAIAPPHAAPHTPPSSADPRIVVQRSPEQAEQLVLGLIAAHADSLLRTARRYSLCADDAQDAYQRALEILMRHAGRLDADGAPGWLHTVVKHEALAINRSRSRSVAGEEVDFDAIEVRTAPSPEDRVLAFDQVARSAEALQRLKPQEVRALWLKAMGNSYQEICDATGWSYTKVNRCLAEGRKSFLARYAGIEEGAECRRWAAVLSAMVDGEATAEQLLQLRPHLRNCAGCRAALRELRGSNAPLAALFPVGGLAIAGDGGGPLDGAGDLLARLWQSLWGDLSDRAATAAFRAQSVAQAIVPGKSMAVLASAAALAGGGVAIDEAAHDAAAPRAALQVPSVSTAADRITRGTVAATPAATTASTPSARPKAKPKRKPERRARVRRHAARVRPAAPAPRVPKARFAAPTPAATAPPTSGAPATIPASRRAAAASSTPKAAPAPGRSGAAGEFAVESH